MMRQTVQTLTGSWGRNLACLAATLFLVLGAMTGCARNRDITAAAMGPIYNYNSLLGRETPPGGMVHGPSSGDNWESCWGADDTFFVVHDDGYGFGLGMPGVAPYVPGPIRPDVNAAVPCVNHGLCRVDGDPNVLTESVRGVNLNPGIYSYTLPATYSRDIYEVDGVLYAQKLYSNQRDKGFDGIHWDFFNVSLMKSTDGGRTWRNHLGQLNTAPPNNPEQCMFSDVRMAWPAFIHYGKGGEAPGVDNADKYVYLVSSDRFGGGGGNPASRGAYLARIPRGKMAALDKNDIQYFRGGDGMRDSNWSANPAKSKPTLPIPYISPKVVYDFAFKRYVMCSENPAGLTLFTAAHPWGPWTELVRHRTPGPYWGSLACNKWTSADGKKMWYAASGAALGSLYPYGFLFNPIYFSGGSVDVYEAAAATKSGGVRVESDPADGTKYATGFANAGDGVRFSVRRVRGKGWHIVKLQYSSTNEKGDSVSLYVNGKKVKRIAKLWHYDSAEQRFREKWIDYSGIYYFNNGANTFEIRQDAGDAARGLMVGRLFVSREETYDEGENVAPLAVASVSSAAEGSSAGAVNDGCAAGGANEWASKGEQSGAWAQLNWDRPVSIGKIAFFDRPDPANRVSSGTLTFSDGGTPIKVGYLQNDGQAGTVVSFPPRTVSWVRFTITGSDSHNCGLAEIEVYADRKRRR